MRFIFKWLDYTTVVRISQTLIKKQEDIVAITFLITTLSCYLDPGLPLPFSLAQGLRLAFHFQVAHNFSHFSNFNM